jgi:coatomer subunit gamma
MGDPSAVLGGGAKSVNGGGAAPPVLPSHEETQSLYAKQLSEVPELASYGPVLKSSSKPFELTESETEYVVTVVKHVFKDHIVFQVRCSRLALSYPAPPTPPCLFVLFYF